MSFAFQFSLDAQVCNPEALFQAAMQKAQRIGRLSHDEAQSVFKPDGKNISVQACLIEMLDPGVIPGCEIQNSDASHVSSDGLDYSFLRR
jgi:hypothetical protein